MHVEHARVRKSILPTHEKLQRAMQYGEFLPQPNNPCDTIGNELNEILRVHRD